MATAMQRAPEMLLDENPDRYCMFPVRADNVWNEYKKAEVTFWTAEDVDLSHDPSHWQELETGEQSFISSALGYLAASDHLIQENIGCRFMTDVELPEARAFYSFQLFKQNVHTEMVSTVVEALFGSDEQAVRTIFATIQALPAFQQKVSWVKQWVHSGSSFPERLVAFAAVSSVFHAGSFAGLYWFKKRGLLPGLSRATDLISRDEGINVEAAGVMYSLLSSKLSDEAAQRIVREAVDIERQFVCEQLPLESLGLDKGAMEAYLRFVGDNLLTTLGHAPAFGVKANPLGWLEDIASKASDVKINLHQAGGMSKAGAMKVAMGGQSGGISFDDDF